MSGKINILIDACRKNQPCCHYCHGAVEGDFNRTHRRVGEKCYVFITCCIQNEPTEKEMDDLILKSGEMKHDSIYMD